MKLENLKFRAWTGERMVMKVVPWQWDFVISLSGHKCIRSNGTGIFGSGGTEGLFEVHGVAFKEIMQFTGLKDSEGVDIYDGDILQLHPNNPPELYRQIIWTFCGFECRQIHGKATFPLVFMKSFDKPLGRVRGNIHQNPELLKNG